MKSFRFLLLCLAGLLIFCLVIFRERQLAHWRELTPTGRAAPRQLAPRFRVADHQRHIVKFERFLGRQPVVLLFFDSELGASRDPHVQLLLQNFEQLQRAGIEVVAISDATPYSNLEAEKAAGREFPFPLLTDIDISIPARSPVHRMYGLYDTQREISQNGLFLIARDGSVTIGPDGKPLPVPDINAALEQLSQGKWPE